MKKYLVVIIGILFIAQIGWATTPSGGNNQTQEQNLNNTIHNSNSNANLFAPIFAPVIKNEFSPKINTSANSFSASCAKAYSEAAAAANNSMSNTYTSPYDTVQIQSNHVDLYQGGKFVDYAKEFPISVKGIKYYNPVIEDIVEVLDTYDGYIPYRYRLEDVKRLLIKIAKDYQSDDARVTIMYKTGSTGGSTGGGGGIVGGGSDGILSGSLLPNYSASYFNPPFIIEVVRVVKK